jgi:pyruvate formate lyase activating enzyme
MHFDFARLAGNIHDPAGQATCCYGCGSTLIGRDGYDITAWEVSADGACVACGTRCPGVFDAAPGRWGRRRRPVMVRAAANWPCPMRSPV